MLQFIGCQKTIRLSDLGSFLKEVVYQLGGARTLAESRVLFINNERPIAVLQDYESYRKLLNRLESSERALQIAETRERMRQIEAGLMGTIPFNQIIAQNYAPIIGEHADVSS